MSTKKIYTKLELSQMKTSELEAILKELSIESNNRLREIRQENLEPYLESFYDRWNEETSIENPYIKYKQNLFSQQVTHLRRDTRIERILMLQDFLYAGGRADTTPQKGRDTKANIKKQATDLLGGDATEEELNETMKELADRQLNPIGDEQEEDLIEIYGDSEGVRNIIEYDEAQGWDRERIVSDLEKHNKRKIAKAKREEKERQMRNKIDRLIHGDDNDFIDDEDEFDFTIDNTPDSEFTSVEPPEDYVPDFSVDPDDFNESPEENSNDRIKARMLSRKKAREEDEAKRRISPIRNSALNKMMDEAPAPVHKIERPTKTQTAKAVNEVVTTPTLSASTKAKIDELNTNRFLNKFQAMKYIENEFTPEELKTISVNSNLIPTDVTRYGMQDAINRLNGKKPGLPTGHIKRMGKIMGKIK